jgi:hypothetical protein
MQRTPAAYPRSDELESSVLVLNQIYAAIRITNTRRALLLLFREAAGVVAAEIGYYSTYDRAAWIILAELIYAEQTREREAGDAWLLRSTLPRQPAHSRQCSAAVAGRAGSLGQPDLCLCTLQRTQGAAVRHRPPTCGSSNAQRSRQRIHGGGVNAV